MRRQFIFILVGLTSAAWGGSFASAAPATSSYLDLNLKQDRYLGGVQHSSQYQNYTLWATDLNLEAKSSKFIYKINPVGQGAFESPEELYFGVPEAFISPPNLGSGIGLTIGRQKRSWSRLDEEFNIGTWQPQLRWDYLAPKQQGLIGVFFDYRVSDSVKLTFFTSPLSIPDQGPQFSIRDGQFESANRWFVQPQSRVELFGDTSFSSDALLSFELDRPSEEEMVMHSSFGLGLNIQAPASPFWVNLNYAYKPRNQIHMGIECANCADLSGPLEITALVHTKIVKHHLVTFESGFDRVDDAAWFSLTADIPNKSGFPDKYAEASLNPMLIGGIAYQHYMRGPIGPSWIKGAYMRAIEFEGPERSGLVSSDQVESSLDRYPYTEVMSIDWKVWVMQRRSNQLRLSTRYSYDLPEKGGWLSVTADWVRGPMTLSIGGDILGAEVDPNSSEAGLFSRYRGNDRFFGGITYVF